MCIYVCVGIADACVYVCCVHLCVHGHGVCVCLCMLYISMCVWTLSMYVSMYVWTLCTDHNTARLHARTQREGGGEGNWGGKGERPRATAQNILGLDVPVDKPVHTSVCVCVCV